MAGYHQIPHFHCHWSSDWHLGCLSPRVEPRVVCRLGAGHDWRRLDLVRLRRRPAASLSSLTIVCAPQLGQPVPSPRYLSRPYSASLNRPLRPTPLWPVLAGKPEQADYLLVGVIYERRLPGAFYRYAVCYEVRVVRVQVVLAAGKAG